MVAVRYKGVVFDGVDFKKQVKPESMFSPDNAFELCCLGNRV